MRRVSAALLTLALTLSAPFAQAQAQADIREQLSSAVEARLKGLPGRLAGLARVDGGYEKPMAAYRGTSNLDPVIAIVVSDAAKPASWRDMAAVGRASATQAELIETLFEGRFGMTGRGGTNTYFGDYLTKQGIKQSWIVEYDGVRITILATIYRAEDRSKTFDAIRRDLLGGIEMREITPAEAN